MIEWARGGSCARSVRAVWAWSGSPERADGQFSQRAALKLIKRGMDSEACCSRAFLRERQILARLDHPNIAHLLDGGIAADGRPYFAMEYVEGLPLLDYCTDKNINLETRICLFLEICAAVRFAHEDNIVVRDMMPSYVLVTANGTVKLLDFGIAKLLQDDQELVATLTSAQRDRPMTPAYAAPEQIGGGEITEATDVYALGGVLYELLTGRRAYDFSGASDAHDVLKIILSTDPVAPGRLKLAAAPVPQKRLRGDLDTIALTALRQMPTRRYASVAAFAGDLENYRTGKPIAARRDRVFYRGYKFLRRHRIGVAAIALSTVVLAFAAGWVSIERSSHRYTGINPALAILDFTNLSQNNEAAWIAPTLAQMLATELSLGSKMHALPDELVRSARADLTPPGPGGYGPQSLSKLRKRLGADYVLSGGYLISGLSQEAQLRIDLAVQDARSGEAIASTHQTGTLLKLPALVDQAGADLRLQLGFSAISAAEKLEVDRAQPPNLEVARHMGIALAALRDSDPARARDELIDATTMAPGFAPAYALLADAWARLGYDANARAAAEQAAAHSEGLPEMQRLRIEWQLAVQQANWDQAVQINQKLLASNPNDVEQRLAMINALLRAGRVDAADAAIAELRKLPVAEDPRIELAEARSANARGDAKAQAAHAQRALRQASGRDAPGFTAEAKILLAQAQRVMGQGDASADSIHEAIAGFQQAANPLGEANARQTLALLYVAQNKSSQAAIEYQNALDIYQRIGAQHGIALIYMNLGNLHFDRGDRDAAMKALSHALKILDATGDIRNKAWTLTAMANMQLDDDASDKVIEAFDEAVALDERAGASGHHIFALISLSEALRMRGELDRAQSVCAQALAEAEKIANKSAVSDVWRNTSAHSLSATGISHG